MDNEFIEIEVIEADYDSKLFPDTNLTIDIVRSSLLKYLEENYSKSSVDFYELGDEEFISDISLLRDLDDEYIDKYLKIVKDIDNSDEEILSRYCEIIGLNKLLSYDSSLLKFDEEKIKIFANSYSDTPYEYIDATYNILADDDYYKKIVEPDDEILSLEDKKRRFRFEREDLEDELGIPNYYLEEKEKVIH